MDKIRFIYTTWPNRDAADRAAQDLVKDKLVACANVLPAGRSYFIWKDQLEAADETVVIFKTTAAMEKTVEQKIKAIHPYECPCIMNLEVSSGHEPFLAWISSSVS